MQILHSYRFFILKVDLKIAGLILPYLKKRFTDLALASKIIDHGLQEVVKNSLTIVMLVSAEISRRFYDISDRKSAVNISTYNINLNLN